jgi:hypothetical protein
MATVLQKTGLGIAAGLIALSAPILTHADGTGLMLGAGGYYGAVDDNVDGSDFNLGNVKIDDSSGAYNLDIGYRFNKWIAVDAGYWGLGEYKSDKILNTDFTTDASAWTVGGIASVPIWIIDIYARGGAAYWETDTKGIGDDDGVDAYYGLGAAFNLGGSLDIYGEWIRFDLNTDLDLLGIGVRWTF